MHEVLKLFIYFVPYVRLFVVKFFLFYETGPEKKRTATGAETDFVFERNQKTNFGHRVRIEYTGGRLIQRERGGGRASVYPYSNFKTERVYREYVVE